MTACILQQQHQVVATETVWPVKPQIEAVGEETDMGTPEMDSLQDKGLSMEKHMNCLVSTSGF